MSDEQAKQSDLHRQAAITKRIEACTDEVDDFLKDVREGKIRPVNSILLFVDANGTFGYYRPTGDVVASIGMIEVAKNVMVKQLTDVQIKTAE